MPGYPAALPDSRECQPANGLREALFGFPARSERRAGAEAAEIGCGRPDMPSDLNRAMVGKLQRQQGLFILVRPMGVGPGIQAEDAVDHAAPVFGIREPPSMP